MAGMSPPSTLTIASPEGQLLLTCARTTLAPEHARRLRELAAGPMDWELLLQAAEVQGIEPLLCWHLAESAPDAAPPALRERLRARFARHARSNLLLSGELVKILARLEAAGIAALAYKGPALAASLYGNLALREFSDLDILVEPRNVLPARELLLAAGYRPMLELTPRQQAAYLKSGCELGFMGREGSVAVEIHWRIAPRHFCAEPTMEEFRARAQTVSLGGAQVRTLGPEDLLLALSLHAAKHVWRGLGWICDISELLRAFPALDWAGIERRAEELGLRRLLYLPLYLAHELLDAPVPAEVLARIAADRAIHAIAGEVQARPLLQAVGEEWSVADHRFFLRSRERRSDRLRYLLRLAMTPGTAEWQSVRLPGFLFPLYPAVRLVRLAAKGVRP
jgi:putative nucleotidyltransferase-like protein